MISEASCIAQIYAPALPVHTPEERRILTIAELTRAIASAQTWLDQFEQDNDETHACFYRDFIRRKKIERDALMTPIVAQIPQDVTN